MITHILVPVFLIFVLCVPSFSQTVCNSTLTGSYTDMHVNGSSCTLDGAIVNSLSLDGGSLRMLGESRIQTITAKNAKRIAIRGTTDIQGHVSVLNSGNVIIGREASVSHLTMRNSGVLILRGRLMRLQSIGSQRVVVKDGTLNGSSLISMFISEGDPTVELCNATIGRAQLGDMPVRIESFNRCPPSRITSLALVKPIGSIFMKHVNIIGTFSTKGLGVRVNMSVESTFVTGAVHAENVGNVSFTSVHLNGAVTLSNVETTFIVGSEFRGKVTIGDTPKQSLVLYLFRNPGSV